MRVIGPTCASVLAFLEPLVAVLVGVVVWKEAVGPVALLGAGLILAAGIAVTRARVEQPAAALA
jgi:drug/metabolite transporter (DMT)-like permease